MREKNKNSWAGDRWSICAIYIYLHVLKLKDPALWHRHGDIYVASIVSKFIFWTKFAFDSSRTKKFVSFVLEYNAILWKVNFRMQSIRFWTINVIYCHEKIWRINPLFSSNMNLLENSKIYKYSNTSIYCFFSIYIHVYGYRCDKLLLWQFEELMTISVILLN